MNKSYIEDKELSKVGNKLCSFPVVVKYLFVESAKKLSYNIKIIKASDMLKFFSGSDLVVLVNKSFWDSSDDTSREAYLYHELKHISVDKSGKIKKVNHDIEEFIDVISKYKAYKPELESIKQLLNNK